MAPSNAHLLRLFPLFSLGALIAACGTSAAPDGSEDESSGGSGTSTGGGWTIPTDGAMGGLGGSSGKPEAMIVKTLPAGFTIANPGSPDTSKGGYKLIGPLADAPANGGDNTCANVLRAVMRDFADSHGDFGYNSPGNCEVETLLPTNRKPKLVAGSGPLAFEEWYTNVSSNRQFAVDFWLEPVGDTFVFDSTSFFPLDEVGYDEVATADDGKPHRFLFTTELHTAFEYKGGETFTFRGDDDVFVYINGHLAVDLGGIHSAEEGSVDLDAEKDALGIEVGKVYDFDLFQAERQPTGSNFRIETTLDFTSCGQILPGDIIK